jgi:hypothetical protein
MSLSQPAWRHRAQGRQRARLRVLAGDEECQCDLDRRRHRCESDLSLRKPRSFINASSKPAPRRCSTLWVKPPKTHSRNRLWPYAPMTTNAACSLAAASSVSAAPRASGCRWRVDALSPCQRRAFARRAPSSSDRPSFSATIMIRICFALDSSGIAAVTSRAASGAAFQAMTIVSGSAASHRHGHPPAGNIRRKEVGMRSATAPEGAEAVSGWASPTATL